MSGRPQVEIGGVRVVRCRAQPSSHERESVHWSISGFSPRDEYAGEDWFEDGLREGGRVPDLVLIGELFAHSEVAMAMVTSEVLVEYPDGLAPSVLERPDSYPDDMAWVAEKLNHALYDTAAQFARQLIAATLLDVDVPETTPEMSLDLGGDDELPATDA